jgi:hypothetical protein
MAEGKVEARFDIEKKTPGTHKFKEVTDGSRGAIGNIYVTKEALAAAGLGDADKIVVTVTRG